MIICVPRYQHIIFNNSNTTVCDKTLKISGGLKNHPYTFSADHQIICRTTGNSPWVVYHLITRTLVQTK